MLDFVEVREESTKNGYLVYPEFIVCPSKDLMIRGRTFYAIWDEERGFWTTDERRVQQLIDQITTEHANRIVGVPQDIIKKRLLRNFSSNKWSEWIKYTKSLNDNYMDLDTKIIFSNTTVKKEDFVTRRLSYPIEHHEIPSWDAIIGTLYDKENREKIEWAIGAIISGRSKFIQKFLVLYGDPGSGKSTILNIIQDMFPGYYALFDAKELVGNGDFSLESLKENSLIAIQHDGDLSRIEDNTKLNSIVSHEEMVVNEKFKSKYTIRFQSFLFMATNKAVKITDAKSGIIRRLIDVSPSGKKIPRKDYDILMDKVRYEFGGIAGHCLRVFEELGERYYDSYIPMVMIDETNEFYNFILENLELFKENDPMTLKVAWKRYKEYCEDALVSYPFPMRVFKAELKTYYREFHDRLEGSYNVFTGFDDSKFITEIKSPPNGLECVTEASESDDWLDFKEYTSVFDDICKSCYAQYTKDDGTPIHAWDNVKTTLSMIDTRKLHYVRVPEHHIVIDFDLKDEHGEKSLERNKKEALKWPKTYAEVSKSGSGIHLHYIYKGDVSSLRRLFAPEIEIKIFTGKASLRRKLSVCNNLGIRIISSGLPIKEAKRVVSEEKIKSERGLRDLIKRNLRKEIHPNTKPSIDFIYDILEETYKSGLCYDVTDLRPAVQNLAMGSSHQATYCLNMVSKMKFCSDNVSADVPFNSDSPLIFLDIEIWPNLFLVCFKKIGDGNEIVKLYNPTPEQIEEVIRNRFIGFNNRDYDNHILYAKTMGYSVKQLFNLSQRIIVEKDRNAKFGEAYNLSYTDVYDYLSAANKMSLKKWEIKLHIHHQECPYPWDEPLSEDKWEEAGDYCGNDVIGAEAVWNATQEDFKAREILAEWANMTVNDTTNSLTTKLIVGNDPNPQRKFVYTDLSTIYPGYEFNEFGIDKSKYKEGVKIVQGKSIYKGKDPGEGGYAIGYPGVYTNAALLDVESMHPTSIVVLNIFGDEYTLNYSNIKDARLGIKHGDYEAVRRALPKELHKYLDDEDKIEELSTALKTPINSAYGLTSAKFPNKLRDPRNKDNIVAKYGALFMIDLEEAVTNEGYKVIHIKTDSIKIADATPEIIEFVFKFGEKYGFTFEHEATYDRIALMNDAVYIAKYASSEWCMEQYGRIPKKNKKYEGEWTATGTQFQVPMVFKSLFSHEPIDFWDYQETKSVTTSMYLDFNERLEGEDAHDMRFVGRVGAFMPVKPGLDGGILLRKQGDKYNAVNGTKVKGSKTEVYRWVETEMAKNLGYGVDELDFRYYQGLIDEAIDDISKYYDFDAFVSDSPIDLRVKDDFPMNEPLPFD